MAAPSVSGLTTVRTLNFDISTSGITSNATIVSYLGGTVDRIIVDHVVGVATWLEIAFDSPQNLTGRLILFSVYAATSSWQWRVGLYSTSNTNTRTWPSTYSNNRQIRWSFLLDAGNQRGGATDAGTFDITSVLGIRFEFTPLVNSTASNLAGFEFGLNNANARFIYSVPYSGLILNDGEVANEAGISNVISYMSTSLIDDNTTRGVYQGFSQSIYTPISLQVGNNSDVLLRDGFKNIEFRTPTSGQPRILAPQSNRQFTFNTSVLRTFSQFVVTDESTSGIDFDDISAVNNTHVDYTFNRVNTANLRGKNFTRLTINTATGLVQGGGTINTLRLNSTASIAYAPLSTTTFAGSNEITGTPGHAINITAASGFTTGGSINLSTFDFSGCTPGTKMFRVDIGASATFTINLAQGSTLTASDVTAVNGETVSVLVPSVTFLAPNINNNGFDNVRCRLSYYKRSSFTTSDVNISTNTITISGISGRVTTQTRVRLAGTDLPSPLLAENNYFVHSISTNSFSLSATAGGGGSQVDLTDTGSGAMVVILITEIDIDLVTSGGYTVDLAAAQSTSGITLQVNDQLLFQAADWKGSLQSHSPVRASKYHEELQLYTGSNIATLTALEAYSEHDTFAVNQNTDGYEISQLTVTGSDPVRYQWRVDASAPGKVQIESEDPDRNISTEQAVLFFQFIQWTEPGMRLFRGQILAENLNSIQIRSPEVGVSPALTVESFPAEIPLIVSGPGMYRTDGVSWIATGSSIQHQPLALTAVPIPVEVATNLSESIVNLLHVMAAGIGHLTGSGGSGGLTTQQVRDALKLAPSAGTPADGSIDAQLGIIDSIVDNILLDTDELQQDWADGGRLDLLLDNVPNTPEFEARTLSANEYFDPSTDTVATVGTVTNAITLPSIPNNWITAAGIATDAIDADALAADAIAEINATVDDALTDYNALVPADLPANFALLAIDGSGNVSTTGGGGGGGDATEANQATIINTLAAMQGTGFDTSTDSLVAIRDRGDTSWTTATGFSTLTAQQVWEYSGGDRLLSGAQATNLDATISSRSTFNPATTAVSVGDKTGFSLSSGGIQAIWDALTSGLSSSGSIGRFIVDQLNALVGRSAPLDSTATQSAVSAALTAYTVPTLAQVQSVGFTTERNAALISADAAARAVADGRHIIDYGDSTATQYNADGTVRTVFDLLESDGTTPATTGQAAVERRPQ